MSAFKTILMAILWIAIVVPCIALFAWCFFIAPAMVFLI